MIMGSCKFWNRRFHYLSKIRLEIETSMNGCQPLQKEKILSALMVHGRNEWLTQKIHSIILESFC